MWFAIAFFVVCFLGACWVGRGERPSIDWATDLDAAERIYYAKHTTRMYTQPVDQPWWVPYTNN